MISRLSTEVIERIEFEGIQGGRERAEQIVGTILRQKELLERSVRHRKERSTTAHPDVEAEQEAAPTLVVSL